MLQRIFTLLFGFTLMLLPALVTAQDFDDFRYGVHPYELRRYAMEERRELVKRLRKISLPDEVILHHPSRAAHSVLHPFYRRGGISYFQGDNKHFTEWRGYMPPYSFMSMSPDSDCFNYTGIRANSHTAPYGYQCW